MESTRDSFVEGVEVREGQGGAPSVLTGYAAVFGQESIITGGDGFQWRERIDPAAFQAAIGRDDVIAAVNHDHKQVLGRTKSGTLTLSVDAHGLRYEVKLGRTTLAQDTIESVRRGDYTGSSFKFIAPHDGVRIAERPTAANPLPLVILEKVKLIDVGPVTFPAYVGTSVGVRSVPDVVAECYRVEKRALIEAEHEEMARQLAERKAWRG